MNDSVAVPSLGARWLLSHRLEKELVTDRHVLAAEALKQFRKGGVASDGVKPLAAAFRVTETSPASAVLFFSLVVVTLGIYLLWALCLVDCISSDPGSFYRLAMKAMDDLCKGSPEAKPLPEPNPPADGEITQLEPGVSEEVNATLPFIPDENSFKDLCEEIFAPLPKGSFMEQNNHLYGFGDSSYELFSGMKFEEGALRESIKGNNEVLDTSWRPYVAFNIDVPRSDKNIFVINPGISGKMWNELIQKLILLRKCKESTDKIRETYRNRNSHIARKLNDSLAHNSDRDIFQNVLTKKVERVFLMALDDAVSKRPLSDFYTARQSTNREEFIFVFIRIRIASFLKKFHDSLECSFTTSSRDRLKLARNIEVHVHSINEISEKLTLQPRDRKFRSEDVDSDPDTKSVFEEFNRLLLGLDATVRKLLLTTPFEFVLKFDRRGAAELTEEMTMLQYLDAIAQQWSEEMEGESGKTNGAALQEAEDAFRKLPELAEFLRPIDLSGK